MPIASLICPVHLEDVQPDHFGPGRCVAVPRAFAEWVMRQRDDRPSSGVSVTELLGCLRETAIQRSLDVSVDPSHFLSIFTGTAAHWMLQDYNAGDVPRRIRGVLGAVYAHPVKVGTVVSGEPDLVKDGVVVDYKWTGSLWNLKEPRPDHVCQVSLYGLLLRQNGIDARLGLLHYGGFGPAIKSYGPFPLWDEQRILGYEIAPGVTVEEQLFVADRIGFDKPALLPLTGEAILYGGKTKCSAYCAVAATCRELRGEAF